MAIYIEHTVIYHVSITYLKEGTHKHTEICYANEDEIAELTSAALVKNDWDCAYVTKIDRDGGEQLIMIVTRE